MHFLQKRSTFRNLVTCQLHSLTEKCIPSHFMKGWNVYANISIGEKCILIHFYKGEMYSCIHGCGSGKCFPGSGSDLKYFSRIRIRIQELKKSRIRIRNPVFTMEFVKILLENEQFLTNLWLLDPLFFKRIRIREKITDPTDPGSVSGSETLHCTYVHCTLYTRVNIKKTR